MKKEMLINCLQPEEIRIAICEDGVLEELYVERASQESYVGNIYKGRVVNIEPSIQAAFVDFGVGRNGFLHVSDVEPAYYRHVEERQRRGGDRGGDRGGRGGRPQQRNYDDYDRPRRGGSGSGGGGGSGYRQPPPRRQPEEDDVRDRPVGQPEYPPEPSMDPRADDVHDSDGPDIIVEEILSEDDFYEAPVSEPTEPIEAPASPEALADEGWQSPEASREGVDDSPPLEAEVGIAPPSSHSSLDETVDPEPVSLDDATEIEAPAEGDEAGDKDKPRRRGRSKPTGRSPRPKKPRKRSSKDEGESSSESQAKDTPPDEPRPKPMDSTERRTDENDPSLGPIEPRPSSDLRDEDLSFSMAPTSAPKHSPRHEPKPEPKWQAPPTPPVEQPAPPETPRIETPQPQGEPMGRFEEAESLEEIIEEEKALEADSEVFESPEQPAREEGPIVDMEDERGEIDEYVSRESGPPPGGDDRGRGRGDRGNDRGGDRGGDRGRGRNDRGPAGRGRGDRRGGGRDGGRDGGRGGRDGGRDGGRGGRPGGMVRPKPHIEDIFKRGQEVLVQVIKEGIGTKGPTLSTYISIAGRYLVLMPGLNRIGVSRKIDDEGVRRRLREIMNELHPPRGIGFIIRTAGQDRNKKELQSDLAYLSRLWEVVVRRIKKQKSPCEIYKESDMVTRTIRDIFTNDIDTIWVDEKGAYEAAKEFMEAVMPRYAERIKFYEGAEPMFHKYGIENEMARIQMRHVPLPHGGSIVIDQTEALVAIDVNSGNFRADNNNAEETAYQMNQHAAKEIARQLRLRDLGGVIVNDFIDMRDERHRRGVERALRDAVRRDRARTKILRISQFGIIEMTRQRIRPSLKRSAFQDCPYCHATGHVKTCESVSIEVMRMLQLAVHREQIQRIEIRVHETVAQFLQNRKRKEIVALEEVGVKNVTIHSAGSGVSPEFLEFVCFDANNNEVKFANQEEAPRPPRRRGH